MTRMSVTMLAALLFGIVLAVSAHVMDVYAADETAPKCKTAEVNPVTGHVFCIDPLGAEVAPPPDSMKPKCGEESRGQWSWAPNCEPVVEGM